MKTNIVVLLTGMTIIFLVNFAIWQKQTHLDKGEEIFLELAPVDPRSLMQGDYMALRFELSDAIQKAIFATDTPQQQNFPANAGKGVFSLTYDGFVVVEKDINQVAQFVRINNEQAISSNQRKLQFRIRNNKIKFATNAFFFEEGDGAIYQDARYGVFRLNDKGEVLLTGMLDANRQPLGDN